MMEAHPQTDLRRLFWQGFGLRAALAVILYLFTDETLFAPDQGTYRVLGEMLASYWSGETLIFPGRLTLPGPKGYPYIVGVFHWLGLGVLAVQFLNCMVGALTILVIYDLARRMTGNEAIAMRSARLVAFFPSLVLWSALNIRDAWIIFLIAFICRQAILLQDRPGLIKLALLGGAVWALIQFRDYVLFAVTVPMVVSFLGRSSSHFVRNVVLGMVAALIVIYADQAAGTTRRVRLLDLEELHTIRHWNAYGAASQFEAADISTPEKALVFLPKGLAYFLLAPFPWMLGSVRQILAVPETLYFYSLLPALIRGIRHLLRHHLANALMVILVTAGLTFGYALAEGNAGTAYRHRAQLLSFYLLFAAVGIEVRRQSQVQENMAPLPRPA